MASRLIRNQLPSNGLRVRAPCPPLFQTDRKKLCVLRVIVGGVVMRANRDPLVRHTWMLTRPFRQSLRSKPQPARNCFQLSLTDHPASSGSTLVTPFWDETVWQLW